MEILIQCMFCQLSINIFEFVTLGKDSSFYQVALPITFILKSQSRLHQIVRVIESRDDCLSYMTALSKKIFFLET